MLEKRTSVAGRGRTTGPIWIQLMLRFVIRGHTMNLRATAMSTSRSTARHPDRKARGRAAWQILTPEAVRFLTALSRKFEPRRQELLGARRVRQQEIDQGDLPDFLPETAEIRNSEWKVAPIPQRPAGPARRDHRARRSQDDHQRAELRRERVHGRFRGLELADLAKQSRRANRICAMRSSGTISYASPEGKRYEAEREARVL